MISRSEKLISGRKWWRIVCILLVIALISIQFYRPNKNIQDTPTANDFLMYQKAPENVVGLITNSCYSCHSDHSDYTWYDNIAPISWYVDRHVKEAKESLNLSEWAGINYRNKRSILALMNEKIIDKSMPLPSYTFAHSDAVFSEEDIEIVLNWLRSIEVQPPSF